MRLISSESAANGHNRNRNEKTQSKKRLLRKLRPRPEDLIAVALCVLHFSSLLCQVIKSCKHILKSLNYLLVSCFSCTAISFTSLSPFPSSSSADCEPPTRCNSSARRLRHFIEASSCVYIMTYQILTQTQETNRINSTRAA